MFENLKGGSLYYYGAHNLPPWLSRVNFLALPLVTALPCKENGLASVNHSQPQNCLQIAEVGLKTGIGWLFLHATAFSASALARCRSKNQTDRQTYRLFLCRKLHGEVLPMSI